MSDIFRKFRFTFIALLLLIIIGGYYFIVEKNKETTEDKRKPLFSDLNKDEFTAVELVYPDSIVVATYMSGQWYLLSGEKKYKADKYSMESILENITGLKVESVVSETGANMSEYGLDNPVVIVKAKTKSGEYSFKVGDKSPVGAGEYASSEEGKVVLVDSSQLWPFQDRNLNDLRDKEVINLDEDLIKGVKFKSGVFDLTLVKSDGLWTNDNIPQYIKLNHLEVEGIARSFSDLRVMSFVDSEPDNLSEYGLDKPSYTLTLVEGEKDNNYFFGKKNNENNFYGKLGNNDSVFVISSYNFDQLPQNLNDLRIKKLFDVKKDDISSLVINKNNDVFSINKTDGKWFLTKNEEAKKEFNIDDLLSEIINLEINEFVDDKPKDLSKYGLDKPATNIKLNDTKENKHTLLLGNTVEDDEIYVKEDNTESVYLINNTINNLISEMTDKTVIESDAGMVGSK